MYYLYALGFGASLVGVVILAIIISQIIQFCWSWVDEEDQGKNYIFNLINYKGQVDTHPYRVRSEYGRPIGWSSKPNMVFEWMSDLRVHPDCIENKELIKEYFVPIMVFLLTLPVMLYFCFDFYIIVSGIGLAVALAHSARFTRRLAKKFKSHVKDANAHESVSTNPVVSEG